jgi:antitoxin component YwqK of YwqJK toxin-antitoxin module
MSVQKPLFIGLAIITICLASCSYQKLSLDQMLSQDKFQISRSSEGINSITVSYYDTVSTYDSPYQRFMLNSSDKPNGQFNVYDENGLLRRTLYYSSHLREGKDTWFYADGQVMQEKVFVHDQYVSYKTYYPGRFIIDTELSDTLGFKRHWDYDGNLIYEKNYRTGDYKEWYSSGKIRAKGMECPGECFTLQGPWSYYNERGNLDEIVFFHGSPDPEAWDSIYHYQGDKIISIDRVKPH